MAQRKVGVILSIDLRCLLLRHGVDGVSELDLVGVHRSGWREREVDEGGLQAREHLEVHER